MPHNHNQMTNSIIIWITCKQVSSKNKFSQCAQERDVTVSSYENGLKFVIHDEINDHKIHLVEEAC